MKEIHITRYQCETCGHTYAEKTQALECEARPVSQDKGVTIGDKVLVTTGEGRGETATVTRTKVVDMDWGHCRWQAYWHTVIVDASLPDGSSRMLTFDNYEVVR